MQFPNVEKKEEKSLKKYSDVKQQEKSNNYRLLKFIYT